MIVALLPHLVSLVIGSLVVHALLSSSLPRSVWIKLLVTLPLGYAVGAGLTSCLYFILVVAGAGSRSVLMAGEAVLLAGSVALFMRNRDDETGTATSATPLHIWLLRGAFLLAIAFSAASWSAITSANPHGDWDATAIWNLRAKFLISGDPGWRLGIAPPELGTDIGVHHPTYPILVSSATAQAWTLTGTASSEAPALESLFFALAVAALLAGAIAWRHSESLGLLAGLVFLASGAFITGSPAQYADIPLSLYVLGSLVALEAAARDAKPWLAVLAGICAGFAALTKNEGIAFIVFFLAVAAWRLPRRQSLYVLIGSAPAIALTIVFKTLLSKGNDGLFPATMGLAMQRIADPSRWAQVVKGYFGALLDMGSGIAHPLLLIALLCIVLRFVPAPDARRILWHGLPAMALLAVAIGVYLITNNDLQWQLDTSVSRVIAQAWPAFLWMALMTLRAPESLAPATVAPEPTRAAAEKPAKRKKRA